MNNINLNHKLTDVMWLIFGELRKNILLIYKDKSFLSFKYDESYK